MAILAAQATPSAIYESAAALPASDERGRENDDETEIELGTSGDYDSCWFDGAAAHGEHAWTGAVLS